MKKIFLYEPSIGSDNIGDEIIVESFKHQFKELLKDSFYVELPTHLPISNRYMFFLKKADIQFICGSNLLMTNFISGLHNKQWKININTLHTIKGSIFVGVGTQGYTSRYNLYTRLVYKYLFNNGFLNSVRDSYTETLLRSHGINNIINTGCHTLWSLTESHCNSIPTEKSDKVIFTLTDYKPDIYRDKFIINTLKSHYSELFFWSQGYRDYDYLKSLTPIDNITIIPPHLEDFRKFLTENYVDFIGTRLHGGIFSLQQKRRTFIIAIDNRAKELNKDFNIPVIDEKNLRNLSEIINSNYKTDIHLPIDNIKKFLNQFNIKYNG